MGFGYIMSEMCIPHPSEDVDPVVGYTKPDLRGEVSSGDNISPF